MPRRGWRAGAVGVGLVWSCLGGTAAAEPPEMPSVLPVAASVPAGPPPAALPAFPTGDGAVRDLTPPALAEPVVFAEPPRAAAGDGPAGCVKCLTADPHASETGLFGAAEYLLWRPRRGAFDYAVGNRSAGLATVGELMSLDYELQSGVRGTLGYRLPGSGYEILAVYTHLGSSANARVLAGPGQVILPTLTRPGLVDQAQSAAADASLQYNIYDAVLAKPIYVDEHFSGRVFGGVRFADIRQDLSASYDGLDARTANVLAKSTFYGAGPTFGLEGQFGGWNGLHLYTRVGGGLITGQSNNPLIETNNAGRTTYVNLTNSGQRVVPTATLALGGGWQYRTLSVRFGYEVTSWIGLTDQPRFVDDAAAGALVTRPADLTVEGFVARVGLRY